MGKLRTAARTRDFDASAASVFASVAEDDFVVAAVVWTLAREVDFDRYSVIGQTGDGVLIRALITEPTERLPSFIILFSHEPDDTLLLHYIGHADASAGN